MKLYHAGFNINLPFWPLSHFGTLESARQRYHTFPRERRTDANAVIYELTISERNLRLIEIDDFDSQKPIAVARAMVSDDSALDKIRKEVERLSNDTAIGDPILRKKNARCYVGGLFKNKYDAIKYRNKHEDIGSFSYCFFGELNDGLRLLDLGETSCILK